VNAEATRRSAILWSIKSRTLHNRW